MKTKVLFFIGSRPNFVKAGPLYKEMSHYFNIYVADSGQHYHRGLSSKIYEEDDLPIHYDMEVGSSKIEELIDSANQIIKQVEPALVVVFGDVNTTFAGAVAAEQNKVAIAHIEAGCRCGDFNMQEEQNRRYVDYLSTFHFCSETAHAMYVKEELGKDAYISGNLIIDSIKKRTILGGTAPKAVISLHRAELLADREELELLLEPIKSVLIDEYVLLSHPNFLRAATTHNIDLTGLRCEIAPNRDTVLQYMNNSNIVITDSGGLQQEALYLGVPLCVVREHTEHHVVYKRKGTLVTKDPNKVSDFFWDHFFEKDRFDLATINKEEPQWGDGKAAKRITSILRDNLD